MEQFKKVRVMGLILFISLTSGLTLGELSLVG
jgi:hypothetical protein